MDTALAAREATTPFQMDNPIFDVGQFQAMMQVAKVMSEMMLVPKHLQGKPADCMLVVEQARRWNMSPFAVAQETFVINGKLLFGGKLVTAVINSRAPVKSGLRFDFQGEGDACEVTVSATLKGESEPRTYTISVRDAKQVAGNSSLWKTDPKQQVAYFASRFWARRHCPETILGVWSEDEFPPDPHVGPEHAKEINPQPRRAQPAPTELVEIVDAYGTVHAFQTIEVENVVKGWAGTATDEELDALIENNQESQPFVVVIADKERQARKAQTETTQPPPHEADPLHLNGMPNSEILIEIANAIEGADKFEAHRIWHAYADRVRKVSPGTAANLAKVVADKIAGAE